MFASAQLGCDPELVTQAKSLPGGLPLTAVTGHSAVMDAPGRGGLCGTFAGSPVACEAALAVLDLIEKENLCNRADHLGDVFQKRAKGWQAKWDLIGEFRGMGTMQALELVRSKQTREPAPEETKKISQRCYENGLITITAGSYSNIIRLLMPIVITDDQMKEAMDVMEAAIAAVAEKKEPVAQMA